MGRRGRTGPAAPVDVTCPQGHTFSTTAASGGRTSCAACYREGRGKVNVRVPLRPEDRAASAPSAPRTAATAPVGVSAPAAPLVDAGPPFSASDLLRERAADRPCPSCGAPLVWTTGRTALLCPDCRRLSLPAEVAEYHERRRAAEEKRRRGKAASVARSEAYDREAALTLAEARGRIRGEIADLRERLSPVGMVDRVTAREMAGLRERLAELDRQAQRAEGVQELAEVAQYVAREIERASEYERQAAPVILAPAEWDDYPRALPAGDWEDEEDQEDEDGPAEIPAAGAPIFDQDTFRALAGLAGAGIYLLRNRRNAEPPASVPVPAYSTDAAPVAGPRNWDYLCGYLAPWGRCTMAVTANGRFVRCDTHAHTLGGR